MQYKLKIYSNFPLLLSARENLKTVMYKYDTRSNDKHGIIIPWLKRKKRKTAVIFIFEFSSPSI